MTLMEQYGAQCRVGPLWWLLSRVALAIVAGVLAFPRSPQGSAREPSTTLRAEPDIPIEAALRALGRLLAERGHEIVQANHSNTTRSVESLLRPSVPVLFGRVPSLDAAAADVLKDVRQLFDPTPLSTLQHGSAAPENIPTAVRPPEGGTSITGAKEPVSAGLDREPATAVSSMLAQLGGLSRKVQLENPEVTGSTHLKLRVRIQEDPQRRCGDGTTATPGRGMHRAGTCVLRVRG